MNQDRIKTSAPNSVIFKTIVFPMIIVQLFSGIVQLGDRIISSIFIGAEALAAVSLVFPILMFAIAFGVMISKGLEVEVNYLLGKGKRDEAMGLATFVVSFMAILSIILTSVLLIFSDTLLNSLIVADEFMGMAKDYFFWIVISFPLIVNGFTIGTLIIADGGIKHNSIGMFIFSIGNLVLNAIFVIIFDMGVTGVGVGSALSAFIMLSWNAYYFIGKKNHSVSFGKINVNFKELGTIFYNGSSEFFTIISAAIMLTVINIQINIHIGAEFFMAYAAYSMFAQIFVSPFNGGAFGTAPIVAKANGEDNKTRGLEIVAYTAFRTIIISGIIYGLTYFLINPVTVLSGYSADIISDTKYLYLTLGLVQFITIFSIYASSFLSSLKKPGLSLIISSLRPLVFIPFAAIFFISRYGETGVWLGNLIVEVAYLPIIFIIVLYAMKKK